MNQALWRKYSEWPLLAAAVVFLTAYSIQVIANLKPSQAEAIGTTIWITWAAFAVDYAANLYLAPQKRRWFLRNLHELVILVLPVLRPLRLLRLVTLTGRLVAGGLMIGGIAVLGVVTASVASWLVEHVALETAADVEANEEPLRTEVARLGHQIELLTAQLSKVPHPEQPTRAHPPG